MKDPNQLIAECQQLKADGKSHDDLVTLLRERGCSKVESMTILARAVGVGLGEAKEIVHNSRAWGDVRERDERFHKSLEDGLTEKS